MQHNSYLAIFVMFLTIYAVRALPLTLLRKEITNPFIRSFLYYVPYVTLSVMTFPAILQATQTPLSGALALAIGLILSYVGAGLFPVACSCCAIVFIAELFLV